MGLYSLGGQVPGATYGAAYTTGTLFQSSVAGKVNGIKFYKDASDTGIHIIDLWTAVGGNLGTQTVSGETASGWQYQAFGSPISVSAATNYMISCYHPSVISYQGPVTALSSPFSPLSSPASGYQVAGGHSFPNSFQNYFYGLDLVFDDLGNFTPPTAVRSLIGRQGVVGFLKSITLGGPSAYLGDNTWERHLQTGVREELVDGYPSPPCLALDYPGFWRFRWQLAPGTQTISVWAKQVSNVTGKRPQMIVKANPTIGLAADVVGTAASSTGWTKIGPIGVTASAAGVVWVELWNKDTDTFYSTSYFDTIGS